MLESSLSFFLSQSNILKEIITEILLENILFFNRNES